MNRELNLNTNENNINIKTTTNPRRHVPASGNTSNTSDSDSSVVRNAKKIVEKMNDNTAFKTLMKMHKNTKDMEARNPFAIVGSEDDPNVIAAKESNLIKKNQVKKVLKPPILDNNPFALLDSDENPNDLAAKESNLINKNLFRKVHQTPNKKLVKQRIPPIVITQKFKNPKKAMTDIMAILKGNVSFKILREGYSVTLETLDDHGTIKQFLAQQKIPFYTYTTRDKKPVRLVLKGVHHTYTPEEIVEDLSTKKIKAESVQPMFAKGKVPMDMFIVNFEQSTKIMELTKTVKYVCHQTVSWQPFIKKDIGTQCRKCQRFGHAASNCGLEYRCVKCIHRHAPGDCPLEDDKPATCVNCNGNHPANYKKCSAYTKYEGRLTKFQRNSGNNKIQAKRTNNLESSSNGSHVKINQSYSQAVRSNNQPNQENNLNFLSSEINSLFNCSLTALLQKIQAFVPEYKQASDPTLKKILIIDFLSQFT